MWEPLTEEEQNGEGLFYIIRYRQVSLALEQEQEDKEWISFNSSHSPMRVTLDQQTFNKYEITVQAGNAMGLLPLDAGDVNYGYSGAGVPLVIAEDLQVVEGSLNSSYVKLSWRAVSESLQMINGFFVGYRVQYWRRSSPADQQHLDIILNRGMNNTCLVSNDSVHSLAANHEASSLRSRPIRAVQQSRDVIQAELVDLWPNSDIEAVVMVLNNAHTGQSSQIVTFKTLEDRPGAVLNARVTEVGSNHLRLDWQPPAQQNGVITNYTIRIFTPSAKNDTSTIVNVPADRQSTRLLDLDSLTDYYIVLSAATSAGFGPVIILNTTTLKLGYPDTPMLSAIDVEHDSLNVSWITSHSGPANKYYVEYMYLPQQENSTWGRTEVECEREWINITLLPLGSQLNIRLVAVNGKQYDHVLESRSDIVTVELQNKLQELIVVNPALKDAAQEKGEAEHLSRSSSVLSLTGLFCALALLLLLIALVCVATTRRYQGAVYRVDKKEKHLGVGLWGQELSEFGEYSPSTTSLQRASDNTYLNNDIHTPQCSSESHKPAGDDVTSHQSSIDDAYDSDGLDEYDEFDASKFNEDGSFIGVYRVKDEQHKVKVKEMIEGQTNDKQYLGQRSEGERGHHMRSSNTWQTDI